MSCKNKLKYTCGTKNNARCTFYDAYIPEDSELIDEECVTIEETTEDTYKRIDTINEELDLSDLGNNCIEYNEEEAGVIKTKEALLTLETELCTLKETIEEEESNIDISTLDTKCLVDECGTGFSNANDLLQALIDKVCELETNLG